VIKALQGVNHGEPEKRKLKNIGSFGSVYKLRAFLDGEETLRVDGRHQNSTLECQSKHQLLLPSKHHVAKLLIMDVHESVEHLGQEYAGPDQFETEILDYSGMGRCLKST